MIGKKGLTPIIAIILLLMMTVAVSGAAFFWLSRIQNQVQGGVESFQRTVFTQTATGASVIDADYNNSNEHLSIFLQNTGSVNIPITTSSDYPTTTWLFRDSEQVAICATNWNGTEVTCTSGCGSDLGVGEIRKVELDLNGGECDIGSYTNGSVFSFTIDFSGKTTASGSFVK